VKLSRVAVVILGVLSMAPTAGDVGGCGTEAEALDPGVFAAARKDLDCRRCQECGLGSTRCSRACNPAVPSETAIPATCQPLLHDGEVCIRKLDSASCDAFATYVSDVAPSTPTECEFCKVPPQGPTPGFGVTDAATPLDGAR
jgi:hypothetical protein